MLEWLLKWWNPPAEEMESDLDIPALKFRELPLEKRVEVLYTAQRNLTSFITDQTKAYLKMAHDHNVLQANFDEVLQQLILMAENYKALSENQKRIMASVMGAVEEMEENEMFGDMVSHSVH